VAKAIEVSMRASTGYATSDDFCRIFSQEIDSLYLLGLLLTGDPAKAEQCFVAGIGDSVEGNPVFREWARSWARRAIIRQAIRIIEPAREKLTTVNTEPLGLEIEPRLMTILELADMERFAFVMSVLEGYSYQDCATLLGSSRQDVVNARARALEHLAKAGELVATYGEGLPGAYTLAS
jgi:hypothetical protein